jgi:hypothetical protein
MKRFLATAVITVMTGAALAVGAFAQTAGPPANPSASTPAVANPNAYPGPGKIPHRESRVLQRFRSNQRQGRDLERQGFQRRRDRRRCTRLPRQCSREVIRIRKAAKLCNLLRNS